MIRFFDRTLIVRCCAAAFALIAGSSAAGAGDKDTKITLYAFQFGSDGAIPEGNLIADARGNLYGTTFYGGNGGDGCYNEGCGIIFKVTPKGRETVLHEFQGGSDGDWPEFAGLIAYKGNFYGTTSEGGSSCDNGDGCGTVFKLTPKGQETVLYAFQGGSDGRIPQAGLIADAKGNLYGTTSSGGNGSACGGGCGTVFKVTPEGQETVLYAFQGGSDGDDPLAGLIADTKGNLYGTTYYGGGGDCPTGPGGCGTVFKVTPKGQETVLHAFQDGGDGAFPHAGLIAYKGNFYGTTSEGGGNSNCPGGGDGEGCGTVFKVTPKGQETVLYAFQGGFQAGSDGDDPGAGLIADAKGNLYGTTYTGGGGGGGPGAGTVFKVTPKGHETVLYAFQGGSDGGGPYAGLIFDAKGNLYGTTDSGGGCNRGIAGCGTVFEIKNK